MWLNSFCTGRKAFSGKLKKKTTKKPAVMFIVRINLYCIRVNFIKPREIKMYTAVLTMVTKNDSLS